MNLDDFLRAESTHGLLYAIFCSELGLSSVSHPAMQAEAVLQSFERLQDRAAADVRGSFDLSFRLPDGTLAGSTAISGVAEATLFTQLYGPLSAFTRMHGTGDLEHVLNHLVYPCLGPAVLQDERMCAALLVQLENHCKRYGEHVQKRVLAVLPCFGLSSLADALNNALGVPAFAA